MEGGGFEPPKRDATDLQSAPFGHSGTPPYLIFITKTCNFDIITHYLVFVNTFLKNFLKIFYRILDYEKKWEISEICYNLFICIYERMRNMDMRLECLGATLVVKLSGELDQSCVPEIRDKIDKEISAHSINNLIMDFHGVSFMDSSGIGMLLGRFKLIKARGGKMLIIRTQPQVDKVIELSGLKKIIEFE